MFRHQLPSYLTSVLRQTIYCHTCVQARQPEPRGCGAPCRFYSTATLPGMGWAPALTLHHLTSKNRSKMMETQSRMWTSCNNSKLLSDIGIYYTYKFDLPSNPFGSLELNLSSEFTLPLVYCLFCCFFFIKWLIYTLQTLISQQSAKRCTNHLNCNRVY